MTLWLVIYIGIMSVGAMICMFDDDPASAQVFLLWAILAVLLFRKEKP